MTASVSTSARPRPSRPLPVRVAPAAAPPVDDTSAPWAALLAEPLETGAFEWVMGSDGALVPVAVGPGDGSAVPRRTRFVNRLIGR